MPEKARAVIAKGINGCIVLTTDSESLSFDAENGPKDVGEFLHDDSKLTVGLYLWEGTGTIHSYDTCDGPSDPEMVWEGKVRPICGKDLEELLKMEPPWEETP